MRHMCLPSLCLYCDLCSSPPWDPIAVPLPSQCLPHTPVCITVPSPCLCVLTCILPWTHPLPLVYTLFCSALHAWLQFPLCCACSALLPCVSPCIVYPTPFPGLPPPDLPTCPGYPITHPSHPSYVVSSFPQHSAFPLPVGLPNPRTHPCLPSPRLCLVCPLALLLPHSLNSPTLPRDCWDCCARGTVLVPAYLMDPYLLCSCPACTVGLLLLCLATLLTPVVALLFCILRIGCNLQGPPCLACPFLPAPVGQPTCPSLPVPAHTPPAPTPFVPATFILPCVTGCLPGCPCPHPPSPTALPLTPCACVCVCASYP